MKLTLKQAIDKQKEIVNDLRRCNDLLQRYNSVPKGERKDFNPRELLEKIHVGNKDLDDIKFIIQSTNFKHDMYPKIFRLRTLTTEKSNLIALMARIHSEQDVTISEDEIKTMITEISNEIKELKKELDSFNSSTEVEFKPN